MWKKYNVGDRVKCNITLKSWSHDYAEAFAEYHNNYMTVDRCCGIYNSAVDNKFHNQYMYVLKECPDKYFFSCDFYDDNGIGKEYR